MPSLISGRGQVSSADRAAAGAGDGEEMPRGGVAVLRRRGLVGVRLKSPPVGIGGAGGG